MTKDFAPKNAGNAGMGINLITRRKAQVKGMKNIFLGGEGLFNTVVRGPGHIICQSMPVSRTAMMLYGYMPHSTSGS